MKFSPSIWGYVVNVKLTVKILSTYVAFLENMNFKAKSGTFELLTTRMHCTTLKISNYSDYLKGISIVLKNEWEKLMLESIYGR